MEREKSDNNDNYSRFIKPNYLNLISLNRTIIPHYFDEAQ